MSALPPTPKFADVQNIVGGRCTMCHAKLIAINAVYAHAMPPGIVSEITQNERQQLATWIAAGAPMK
jgi:uncharacterized membrane protein